MRKRENLLFFVMFLLIFVFFCRVVTLQVFGCQFLQKEAKKGHLVLMKLPAFRGAIFDRKGRELAVSLPTNSICLFSKSSEFLRNPENTIELLVECLKINKSSLLERIQRSRDFVWVKRKVEREDYEKVKKLDLPGVGFCKEFKRVYPKGILASHILGFTDIDGKGLEGMELRNDELLKGESGWHILIKDARGRIIPSLEEKKRKKKREGLNVILTIDERIQEIVEEELEKVYRKFKALSATAIVMDPFSGEILGLANRPTFNPDSPGSYQASFRRNRAITDIFEPGSVFKVVVAAAVLEEGIVDPKEVIFCENGKWLYRKHILHDAEPHQNLSFREVIAKSSNIGTVKVALKLGKEKLCRYAHNFGFGQNTGIDLPGEVRGILRTPDKWSKYSMAAIPIGQEVAATPMQAICALAVIANGGSYVKPYFVKEIENSQGVSVRKAKPWRRRIISRETAMTLTSILRDAVEEEGTAPLAKIYNYTVAGKTGTSQKVINGRYSHSKFFSSFIGYAPAENPKVVVLVMVNEPKPLYYGSLVAAPVFREITRRILSYLEVPQENKMIAKRTQ